MRTYNLDKSPKWLYCLFLFLTVFCEFNLSAGNILISNLHCFLLICFFLWGFKLVKNMQTFYSIFLIAIFCNCTSSYLFRGQSYSISFFAYYQLWFLFFFFALALSHFRLYTTEKLLKWIILTVVVIYYVQLVIFPKALWGNAGAEWIANNDLYFRGLVVGGESAVSLGYLFFLNKYLVEKKKSNLILMIVCAIPFFIRGFRIMIMGAVMSTILLYVKSQNNKNIFKLFLKLSVVAIIFVGIVLVLYQYVPIIQSSLDSLQNRAGESNQTFNNDDYIRMVSINYYYTSFFKSPIELFFGAGMIGNNGPVADVFAELMLYNYNLTDWGLIGLSWYAGIPVVLCIVYYSIRGILQQVPKQYLYINAWFLYLLIVSITDPEMYQHYSFLIQSILLYMLYLINPRFLKI